MEAMSAGVSQYFYDGETQAPRGFSFFFIFFPSYGCFGFLNHPSIRAFERIVISGLGS